MLTLALLAASCASVPAPPQVEEAMPDAAEKSAAPVEQEHIPNKLQWTTASEVDNFGFDVYRGEHEDGPFTRLTETPIAGAGTTDLTSKYVWEDMTNDPYSTYYYYVESISLLGVREQFTPIIKAKPKLPAEPEAQATTEDGETKAEEAEDQAGSAKDGTDGNTGGNTGGNTSGNTNWK